MKRPKEIIVLLVLLAGAAAGVLGYVINRRAASRAQPPTAAKAVGPVAPAQEVDLTKHDSQTVDFSSGQPVVKDSPEDRAALEQGLKEIEEATRNVTFEAEKKPEPKKP